MKNKSLFDHIGHITQKQTKGYWNSLNETEKKQWSNYMIHRFLSMKMEWTDFVNEIQKLNLKPKHLYSVYSSILPKGKQYLKYIKKKLIYIKLRLTFPGRSGTSTFLFRKEVDFNQGTVD